MPPAIPFYLGFLGVLASLLIACAVPDPAAPITVPAPTAMVAGDLPPTKLPATPTSLPVPTVAPTAPAPAPTPTPNPAPSLAPAPTLAPDRVAPETLRYFFDIALGTEYGGAKPVLHKWAGDIRILAHGSPTPADVETLEQVIAELNGLIPGLKLELVESRANLNVYFVPRSEFPGIEPNYVPGNLGFFWFWWNGQGAITRARILIDSEGVTQQQRRHILREELTQSLGLARDSEEYPDSIFYQSQNLTDQYTSLDEAVIRLLYNPRLRPGMTRAEIAAALSED